MYFSIQIMCFRRKLKYYLKNYKKMTQIIEILQKTVYNVQ